MEVKPPSTTVIVTSTKDEASTTIANGLMKNHGFESTQIMFMGRPVYQNAQLLLVSIDTEMIDPPDLDTYFNPQAYIFLSRHRSESQIPSLTVHTTGNFTDAPFLGGRPKEIGRINPDLQKNYLIALHSRKKEVEGYEITIEATHHGPTSLQKPVLFVELGSSERQWGDEHAGAVIGDALMETLNSGKTWDKVAMTFGGTHYPAKVNDLLLNSDMAISVAVAKHYLDAIDSAMFGQIIQKTSKFPRFVAIDWKGMGKNKDRILEIAAQYSLEVLKL
jgi:D-aminoacyl-tRNA deacylase